jgi:hypothetical protein
VFFDTTPSPTCAGCKLAHCPSPMGKRRVHYGWLLSQDKRCFSKPPTSTPRPAQRIDLRTATLLWEEGVRAMSGRLAKVTDVFLNHPLLPPGLRRRPSYAFRLLWEGGVRTIKGWLDKITDVFQRYLLSPPELRRRQTSAPSLYYEKETCALWVVG